MPVNFADLSNDQRMHFRNVVDKAGGEVEGYYGPYIQVAIPANRSDFVRELAEFGLQIDHDSEHYFPLGTDNPPEHLRHAMRKYGPARSFWLYARFLPARCHCGALIGRGIACDHYADGIAFMAPGAGYCWGDCPDTVAMEGSETDVAGGL